MGNYKIGFMLDGELVTDYGRFQKVVNTVSEPKIDVPGVLKPFIGIENPTQQQVQAHFSKLYQE